MTERFYNDVFGQAISPAFPFYNPLTFANGSTTTGTFLNATSIPTIATGDYVRIVVEPGTANEEITFLLGPYTGGATTGSFVRAAEISTGGVSSGIAHSSVSWVHSFTGASVNTAAVLAAWQDIAERGGMNESSAVPQGVLVGASRNGIIDVIIGDSIGRGFGASALGVTDYATILASIENRTNGFEDAAPGFVPVLDVLSNNYGWNSRSSGAQATGTVAGPSPVEATAWTLTSAGSISDNRPFRRVRIFYYKVNNGDSITFATTGNVVSSGSLDTNNSGSAAIAVWDSGDLGSVSGTGVTATWGTHASGSGGAGSTIIGAEYDYTSGTQGVRIHNLCINGLPSSSWATTAQWLPWITFLAQQGNAPRRVYIFVGINDPVFGISPASFLTNMQTILTAINGASPLTEVVIVGEHYGTALSQVSGVTVTSGTNTITVASGGFPSFRGPLGPYLGQTLIGFGIPSGTTISSIASNTLTMSQNATASSSALTGGTETVTAGEVSGFPTIWATQFLPIMEALALTNPFASFVNMYDRFGDVSAQSKVAAVTTTAGSPSATVVASTGHFPGVVAGQTVVGGAGQLAPGTTVASTPGASDTLTLSIPAITSATNAFIFSNDSYGLAGQVTPDIHFADYTNSASGRDGQRAMAEYFWKKLSTSQAVGAPTRIATFTASGRFIPVVTGLYRIQCVGGGGGGGGGGTPNSSLVNQVGGGGGGQGEVKEQIQTLTAGTSYTVTIGGAGTSGTGGTANGNAGVAGGNGGTTTFAGATNLVAQGGSGGSGGAASTATTLSPGGGYANTGTVGVGATGGSFAPPGCGGSMVLFLGTTMVGLPGGGSVGIGAGGGGGAGGASASLGGGAGGPAGFTAQGSGGINAASGTANGVSATAIAATSYGGGGGGGGGAATNAGVGGNGGAGCAGLVVVTGPLQV